MSARHWFETEEAYFRRMVELHKPVSDFAPVTPAPLPTSTWVDQQFEKKEWNLKRVAVPEKPKETGARPKTPRKSTATRKSSKPEQEIYNLEDLFAEVPQPQKWLEVKYKEYDNFVVRKCEDGRVEFTNKTFFPRGHFNKNCTQAVMDEKYFLYLQLQQLNLQSPETQAKIQQACSADPTKPVDPKDLPPIAPKPKKKKEPKRNPNKNLKKKK